MSKLKKIFIALLMIILIITILCTISQAYSVGEIVDITIQDYWNDPNIYCAEKDNNYLIIKHIK